MKRLLNLSIFLIVCKLNFIHSVQDLNKLESIDLRYAFNNCNNKEISNHFPSFLWNKSENSSSFIITTFTIFDLTKDPKVLKGSANSNVLKYTPIRKLSNQKYATVNIIDLSSCDDRDDKIYEELSRLKPSRFLNKAKDYFIFQLSESCLLSLDETRPYLKHVGNKVAVSLTQHNEMRIRHLCYFCNRNAITKKHLKINPISIQDLHSALVELFVSRSISFNGDTKLISCSSTLKPRISLRRKKPEGSWEIIVPGVFEKLLSHLIQKLNFTAEYFPSTGGAGTGAKLPNGTWVGVVGDVYYEKAEIGVMAANQFDRFQLLSFATPHEFQSLIIITGKHYETLTWRLLSLPFSTHLWLCLGISFVSSAFFLFVAQNIYRDKIVSRMSRDEREKVMLWDDAQILSNLFAPFFEESVDDVNTTFLRIFHILWLFLAILVSNMYCSKLYQIIGFPTLKFQPRNFNELVETKFYRWGMDYKGEAAYLFIKTSNSPILQMVFEKMDVHRETTNCVQESIVSDYACLAYSSVLDFSIASNFSYAAKEILKESSFSAFTVGLNLAFLKDSPLENVVSTLVSRVVAQGVPPKWLDIFHSATRNGRRIWIDELKKKGTSPPKLLTEEQEQETRGGVVKISWKRIQGAFLPLSVGLTLASFRMVWELKKNGCLKIKL